MNGGKERKGRGRERKDVKEEERKKGKKGG